MRFRPHTPDPGHDEQNQAQQEPVARDPRDMVGLNPTGRERRSSAGKRRQEARKATKGRTR
ncbi:hypothetical protein [Streptomyces sp. ICBB 8177]|uniref:hypothetical protein n=1 Tax=Streptomyces sp. ICBB 8177 TaxID=563922 RepID=UPI000D6847A4|nr:hypothetical protein [Streptomyces sp. ICBB 8177]PWI41145.1 hypothetical protein CK485_27785 [Streptomyces sp. ICBB 8177]